MNLLATALTAITIAIFAVFARFFGLFLVALIGGTTKAVGTALPASIKQKKVVLNLLILGATGWVLSVAGTVALAIAATYFNLSGSDPIINIWMLVITTTFFGGSISLLLGMAASYGLED